MKALFRLGAGALDDEYTSKSDTKDLLSVHAILDKIQRLAMTRDVAKQNAILKFQKRPKLAGPKEEVIADMVVPYNAVLPHDWSRYGNLIAKGSRVNKSRPGSSKGKIGKTKVIGFKKLLNDWKRLEKSLINLTGKKGAQGKRIASQMKKIRQNIGFKTST